MGKAARYHCLETRRLVADVRRVECRNMRARTSGGRFRRSMLGLESLLKLSRFFVDQFLFSLIVLRMVSFFLGG